MACSEIESTGARRLAAKCDVTSVESVAGLFRQTVSTFGTLDILVNNAALVQSGPRNEEMRSKFYKMMTTPVTKESLGVTKDFRTRSGTSTGGSTCTACSDGGGTIGF